MGLTECIQGGRPILMEGALGERLKREYHLKPDENVALAAMIYTQPGRAALGELWGGYSRIARAHGLPFLAATPTRRANRERVERGGFSPAIIGDNVRFLQEVRDRTGGEMYVGGLMGCRGDAYTGEGALTREEAREFHLWQAGLFARAGVDFLFAGIMPTVPEAAGMAQAMAAAGAPYIISFTVQGDGRLPDGASIAEAIARVDGAVDQKPLCYMANCVHPRILYSALSAPCNRDPLVRRRFLGLQANTSPLPYGELDGAPELHCSPPEELAAEMMRLREVSDLQIFGGCCGTDAGHMEEIARRLGG